LIASVLKQPRRLELREVPLPKPEPHEVIVKVGCVGICGTDVAVYRGDYKAKDEVILGHEFNGKVVEIGSHVRKVSVGDHVVSLASWGCGTCHWCTGGLPSYCNSPVSLGRTKDGALAEYIKLPENALFKVAPELSPISAHAVVNLSTALRAVHRAGLGIGDKVLIMGPGFSGLMIVQLCRLAGCSMVVMAGTRQGRLSIARELGADMVVNIREESDWEKRLLQETSGLGFDVCIEASGTASGLLSAVKLVKKGGKVVQFGTSYQTINGLPQNDFYTKEISLIGSKGGFGFYQKAIQLLEQDLIKIRPLVTHQFGLNEASDVFEAIVEKKFDDLLRAVVFC